MVLIHDDIPRAKWRMVVVEQLMRGKDGYVRAANIRYNGGRTNRLISKLYPLEVTSVATEKVDQNTVDDKTNDQSDTGDHMMRRSTRSSAARG